MCVRTEKNPKDLPTLLFQLLDVKIGALASQSFSWAFECIVGSRSQVSAFQDPFSRAQLLAISLTLDLIFFCSDAWKCGKIRLIWNTVYSPFPRTSLDVWGNWYFQVLPSEVKQIGCGCAIGTGCTCSIVSLVLWLLEVEYKIISSFSGYLHWEIVFISPFSLQCDVDEVFLSELIKQTFWNQIQNFVYSKWIFKN